MALTVVEDPNPGTPQHWEDAARACVWQIFAQCNKAAAHLEQFEKSGKTRIISTAGPDADLQDLNTVLECLKMIDEQFEGMVNSFNWFDPDQAYWVEEWKILGSIAAAAGINRGIFNSLPEAEAEAPAASRKKNQKVTDRDIQVFMSCESIAQTLAEKQHDYGHHNIARFGRQGLLVRIHDKIARLRNLSIRKSGEAKNEPIADTYMDIIGYCAIGMMWERGWFMLDLGSDFKKGEK